MRTVWLVVTTSKRLFDGLDLGFCALVREGETVFEQAVKQRSNDLHATLGDGAVIAAGG